MTTDATCHCTVLALPWLLNGSLDAAERRQVREHLIACPQCRAELARTRETLALFGGVRRETVVALAAAESAPATAAGRRAIDGRVLRRLAWAAAIAALLSSGGALWLVGRARTGSRPEAPAQAASPRQQTTRPAPPADVIFSTSFESGSLALSAGSASPATAPEAAAAAKRPAVNVASTRPRRQPTVRIATIDFEGGNLEQWQ